jgi:hypothetical protein
MLAPDTLIVFTHSAKGVDYTPALSGFLASLLVAGMAWWGTRQQRKIAETATRTQREIAADTLKGQLELARRSTVAAARREWIKDFREAAAQYGEKALALHYLKRRGSTDTGATLAELFRLRTLVGLHLDISQPTHYEAATAVNGLLGWAQVGLEGLPAAPKDEVDTHALARRFKSFNDAVKALDTSVALVLRLEWEKLKNAE